MEERTSASGMDAHTPVCPQNSGKISRNGSRNSSWRVRERKMASLALADGLEKVPDDDLAADERKGQNDDLQTARGQADQLCVIRK